MKPRWLGPREVIIGDFAPAPTGRYRGVILEDRGKQLSALSAPIPYLPNIKVDTGTRLARMRT